MKTYRYNILIVGDGPFSIIYPDFPMLVSWQAPNSIVEALKMAGRELNEHIAKLDKAKKSHVSYSDSDKIGLAICDLKEGTTVRRFMIKVK